jgi:hypothetical protein
MPVYVFEARRQKEQLLIDRGNEYKHAVRLFVRRFGIYPASLDALQGTNNMRFLRHRFVDPFTQKDDWRLLHVGPAGKLVDSRVNPPGIDGQNTTVAPSSSDSQSGSDGQTVIDPVPSRPPAVPANASNSDSGSNPQIAEQDPSTPLLQPGQAAQLADNSPNATSAEGQSQPGQSQPDNRSSSSSSSPSMPGTVMGGGIAGVASSAEGRSIKAVKKQTDYSLWEFYYDPTEDVLQGLANLQNTTSDGGVNINGTGAPGTVASPAQTSTQTNPQP